MVITSAIFKIGGKILDYSKNLINTIAQFTQLYEGGTLKKIILIPGGGTTANFVRSIYREFHFNDDLAHWIGIYSMDYNGLELKRKFPHLQIYDNFDNLEEESEGISVFLPYNYLKSKNELPHIWDVTSDSITLYLAINFGLNECFLVKDVDGIFDSNQNLIKEISTVKFRQFKQEGKFKEFSSTDLDLKAKTKPIDSYLLTLIDNYRIPCIILNGAHSSPRIFDYFTLSNIHDKKFSKLYSI
ncbi:MAG: hypothetical protein ACFE75_08630 [Candidatus Hodarchaeota archaeon]